MAANGPPSWRTAAWILVAMVAARSCAMAPFNRWADADLDCSQSPRTSNRRHSRRPVAPPVCSSASPSSWRWCLWWAAAAELNRLTLYLSPLVLNGPLLSYSYMKRITRWSHLVLGLALGLAPSAAWG